MRRLAFLLLALAMIGVGESGGRARAGICPCPNGDALTGVAIAPDGRIVAVGVHADSSRLELLIGRYLPNGSPDLSVAGGNGLMTVPGVNADFGGHVFVGDTGRFLVSAQDELISFRADGTLDPAFGGAGAVKLPGVPVGVVPLADGHILVASPTDLRLLRLDGSTDAVYGKQGFADTSAFASLEDIALARDGHVLVAGRLQSGGAGVARLLPDGRVDTSFGRDGVVPIRAESLALVVSTADGGVLVGWPTPPAYELERLQPDGAPDPGFGAGGTLVFDQLRSDVRVAPEPDGRIAVYVGGSLLRLRTDGTLDPSFGSGGLVSASAGDPRAFALAGDGSIVVVGSISTTGGGAVLLRYASDGTPDVRFVDFALGRSDLYAADLAGGYRRLTQGALISGQLAISPDRSRIAYLSDRTSNEQLYVAAVDGSKEQRMPDAGSEHVADGPIGWSPRGDLIAFTAAPSGCLLAPECDAPGTWIVGADGSNPYELAAGKRFLSWSPDGRQLLLLDRPPNATGRIFVATVDGGPPRLLTRGTDAVWSPNGKQIALVVPTPNGGNPYARTELLRPDGRVLARLGAGDDPAWAPDGRHLLTSYLKNVGVFRSEGRRIGLLRTAYDPQWAPDGRIAYTGSDGGLRLATASGRPLPVRTHVSLVAAPQSVWTSATTFLLAVSTPPAPTP